MPLIIISMCLCVCVFKWKEKHCDVPEFVRETAGQSQTNIQVKKKSSEKNEERRVEKKLSTNEISCKALGDFLLQNGNPGRQARGRGQVKASLVRSEAEEKVTTLAGK